MYFTFAINIKTHETYQVNVFFDDFTHWGDVYTDEACKKFLKKVDACLKNNSIGFVDGIDENLLLDMAELVDDKDDYSTLMFEKLYGVECTADNIVQTGLKVKKDLDDYADGCPTYFDSFESITFDEMPQKSTNLGLINLSSSINGKVTVSESGIDYSGVSVAINKSVILSQGNKYNIYVAWANADGCVYSQAFKELTYFKSALKFVGNVAELPQAQEGEYTLKAYFGKVVGDYSIRLSEIVSLPVDSFEDITYNVETEGGYYAYRIYYDGEIKLSVKFVDTSTQNAN
jgi:hypothetical protein